MQNYFFFFTHFLGVSLADLLLPVLEPVRLLRPPLNHCVDATEMAAAVVVVLVFLPPVS